MAETSFLNVNGYDFPCPDVGFSYTVTTTVDNGRNANNGVVGQRIGRDLIKLDNLKWSGLYPEQWEMINRALADFYVPVTFEDCRTGTVTTVTMYPGDRSAEPLFADPATHKITRYKTCSVNLIDAGW